MPHIAYMLLAAPSCGATCSDRIPAVVAASHKRHTCELLLHSLPDTSCKQLAAPSYAATCCLCSVLPIAAPRTQRKDAGLLLPDTCCKQLAAASCVATCCLCNVLPIAAPRTQRKAAACSPLSNGDRSFFDLLRVCDAICYLRSAASSTAGDSGRTLRSCRTLRSNTCRGEDRQGSVQMCHPSSCSTRCRIDTN